MSVFGKVVAIVLTESQDPLFLLSVYNTTIFSQHFHSYVVIPTDSKTVIHQSKLADYHPLQISKQFSVSSPMFVCLKYHVI